MAITYNVWYNFSERIPKPRKNQIVIYLTKNNKITQFKETAKSEHIERWSLTHWMIIKLPEKTEIEQEPTPEAPVV